MYIYPSRFNCPRAVGHVWCMYAVTWAHAQSCHVKLMENEQSKRDHAEMEQEQSKCDCARARKRNHRDTVAEESKTKEKESDGLRKK